MTTVDLIESLQARIESVVRPLLDKSQRFALVDFPDHPNVGDSAIWLGELAFLAAHGIEPVYFCRFDTYSRERLARAVGNGTIFIHGGGNFGDLWEHHQLLREQVIRDFPENPIVQFPQTIHFSDSQALSRAQAIINAHPDLTVLARDNRSLEFAQSRFSATSIACPDMAFCLGPIKAAVTPDYDVLVLARTDKEKRSELAGSGDPRLRFTDWLAEPLSLRLRVNDVLTRLLHRSPDGLGLLDWVFRSRYTSLPRERLQRGVNILASGRVVVTDRLHAHIISTLLGLPHFLLDNNYGKNRDFFGTWTRECPLTTWCESESEAMRKAQALATQNPAPPDARVLVPR